MINPIPVRQAALLVDLGNHPLAILLVVLIGCGVAWLVWSRIIMPLLAKVVAEPFLSGINWIVLAILIFIALGKALEVFFGITLFQF